ncbi:MAG: ATP-dependent 6-phosphofructokinase [Deltaproteobacteria bacterium]|nr:ATP-dependent 6-phosphofructokinase [Deltaproteobacteria bacterium]MBN2671501.1 ATP-dependent 6-phosphofructokinase [Deltaproteobacteria bacterium]
MLYQKVFEKPEDFNFNVDQLGRASVESPIVGRKYVKDEERVLFGDDEQHFIQLLNDGRPLPSFEKAGPRQLIYHDPSWTRAAIVTCGGLCPGLNDVIKSIVETLYFDYGVRHIFGIRYGYEGLIPEYKHEPMMLDPDAVDKIHEEGGTVLGSSRGPQDVGRMCDTLERLNVNMLFCIGGDGTLRGAHEIAREVKKRDQKVSVVGIPKTIDNDLSFIGRSFGFETSVYSTSSTLTSAHMEAKGALRGIGLVKLMGRDSGFIAAYASLSNSVVNFCLIPEQPFALEGENGLLRALERRFESGKDHAVIVVAEGAGQELFKGVPEQRDASGNVLKNDIGPFLKAKINAHFKSKGISSTVKYFDPSYAIRSVPAFGTDAILCYGLAENAVHAAMAGKNDLVVGHNGRHFMHVPIEMAVMQRQKVDVEGPVWNSVLSSTRQNDYFNGSVK